ncbi:hypothetical protein BDD43_1839 [Mucilaginibacter gracilis]|uniref:Outer membrane protein with beta-barrel domain n=1 Tax=Mucilaginibacter gracilis TaxID=423350 RepID=A0A495J0R2_9SPHI|nr:hypothetical protein [Mucilaginibacter gracilis]RKR81689.1 hypothetical protein BDD43_1839 [Mucilaginibacter gracilis]
MKKLLLIALLFNVILFTAKKSTAQTSYQFAAGLKFGGYENGISGKYFAGGDVSLEGILGFRSGGVVITGLYEINQTAFNVAELKFYYGAGAHIGSVGNSYQRFGGSNNTYANNQLLLGVDGVIGLEYIIPKSPIAVSLDLNPRVELSGGPFVDLAPGLGIKYCF